MRIAPRLTILLSLLSSNLLLATGIPELAITEDDIETYLASREEPFLAFALDNDEACPTTPEEWVSWRDTTIQAILEPTTQPSGVQALDHVRVVVESDIANEFIKECWSVDPPPPTLENFSLFVRTLAVNRYQQHRFGFQITDSEYLAAISAQIELPDLLKSQEFLTSLTDTRTYKRAYDLIEAHNRTLADPEKWTVLLYRSRFLGTPDESKTRGRFFVLVPDEGNDKWIQFGILPPGETLPPGVEINNLSIVSLAPEDGTGLRPTAIADIWRTIDPETGSVSLAPRYEAMNQTENCNICHKTSPLGIRPAEEYVFDANGALVVNNVDPGRTVGELNRRIRSYGPPHYRGWVLQAGFGPTIGPTGRDRPDSFMRACASPVPLDQRGLDNVRRAMRCSSCHNDFDLGQINYPQAPTSTFSIGQLEEYVLQGWMPPRNRLSSLERRALLQCLKQEYHDFSSGEGLLVSWLRQQE